MCPILTNRKFISDLAQLNTYNIILAMPRSLILAIAQLLKQTIKYPRLFTMDLQSHQQGCLINKVKTVNQLLMLSTMCHL